MKTERSDVDFPIWRKKVDKTILKNNCTPIPGWVLKLWGIEAEFRQVDSKKNTGAKVSIQFKKKIYSGYITCSRRKDSGHLFRLFIEQELCEQLKKVFIMSYIRSVEGYLRENSHYKTDVEKDIPFWEFLDIEYDSTQKIFHFTAYYTQEPLFPELFKSLVQSTVLKQFEIGDKFPIIKSTWLRRHTSIEQIHANNVIYYLIDTTNKLIYIGEAERLHNRFKQGHVLIPGWDFYRYDILPAGFSKKQRVTLERMLIYLFASVLNNTKNTPAQDISNYTLTNLKIDS